MAAPAVVLAVLVVLLRLVRPTSALGDDTSGTLTIVVIVLTSSAGVGGIAIIAWYCYKHGKKDTQVKPKPPSPPKRQALVMAPQPMMLVSPGMQGYAVPAGGVVMGYTGTVQPAQQMMAFPGTMSPGQQFPTAPFSAASPAHQLPGSVQADKAPKVEDLDAPGNGK